MCNTFCCRFSHISEKVVAEVFGTFYKRGQGFVSSCTFLNAFPVLHATFIFYSVFFVTHVKCDLDFGIDLSQLHNAICHPSPDAQSIQTSLLLLVRVKQWRDFTTKHQRLSRFRIKVKRERDASSCMLRTMAVNSSQLSHDRNYTCYETEPRSTKQTPIDCLNICANKERSLSLWH